MVKQTRGGGGRKLGDSLTPYSHPTAISLPLELQTQSRRDESRWTFKAGLQRHTSSDKATLPELPQTEPPAEEQVLKWQRLGGGHEATTESMEFAFVELEPDYSVSFTSVQGVTWKESFLLPNLQRIGLFQMASG